MTRSYEEYCDAVEVEAAGFAEAIQGADPARPVPTCPGWTLAELVKHHGTSQRRVEYVVRHLSQEPVWAKDVATGLPTDESQYAEWFAAGLQPLMTTLRAADPDAGLWTNGADKHVRYWGRRILFEAVVHRADAELALGRGQPSIDARTGADGIDELLTNLLCFPWVAERLQDLGRDGETLHLQAPDLDTDWLITLDRAGFHWQRATGTATAGGTGTATAGVSGSAGDLLLLVYGRLKPTSNLLNVTGDTQLLTTWLTHAAL